jgi:hypothetical protein
MIKEIAIEPEVMATWQHFRELWEDCGVSRGRLLSEFPSGWRELVCQRAYQISSAKAASIAARLKPSPGQVAVKKWISTTRPYDKGKDWLTNAEKHEPTQAFGAIVAKSNPRENRRVLVAGDFSKDQAPWLVLTQREISRTAQDLIRSAKLLLEVSEELVLVDRNFDVAEDRFRDPFAALVGSRTSGKSWKRCELHLAHPMERNGNLDKAVLRNRIYHLNYYLPALIPNGTTLNVFFWIRKPGGKRLHPRFILTEIGGLQLDYGLDEGDSPGDTMIVSLMAEPVWASARNDYCAASQSFDITPDCRVSIAGQK